MARRVNTGESRAGTPRRGPHGLVRVEAAHADEHGLDKLEGTSPMDRGRVAPLDDGLHGPDAEQAAVRARLDARCQPVEEGRHVSEARVVRGERGGLRPLGLAARVEPLCHDG